MQDKFLKSIDNEIRMQIAHQINGVPANKRPGYYGLCRLVEKEKEILAEKSQCKDSTHQAPRGTSVFHKPNWLAQKQMPSARMMRRMTTLLQQSNQDERTVTVANPMWPLRNQLSPQLKMELARETEAVFRVARVMEDMTWRCFHCGKEGHRFKEPECSMYNVNHFLNQQGDLQGPGGPG